MFNCSNINTDKQIRNESGAIRDEPSAVHGGRNWIAEQQKRKVKKGENYENINGDSKNR